MLEVLQKILNLLGEKLFINIIPGQGVLINNKNFDSQFNKLSSNNPTNICVPSEEQTGRKKNRIRRLQGSDKCDEGGVLGMDSSLLSDLMKNETSSNLGFQSQFNKNKILPVVTNSTREVYSETSLGFGLSIGDDNKLRRLSSNSQKIHFEIRLKTPTNYNTNTSVSDTACVQYSDGKNPLVSCESWYDDIANEVICFCDKQGLTVNVMDKALANINKFAQFPPLSTGLRKKLFII
jgi:hypothetical protein